MFKLMLLSTACLSLAHDKNFKSSEDFPSDDDRVCPLCERQHQYGHDGALL